MKKLTEEMLCLSGFRYDCCGHWDTHSAAGSRLCFNNSNPLIDFRNLVSWGARSKINLEITSIVFDKTNKQNITENY